MNFLEDPSDSFYKKKNLNSDRQLNGVYKDLSKTSCFTSIITAGLWRLFGGHIEFSKSKIILTKDCHSSSVISIAQFSPPIKVEKLSLDKSLIILQPLPSFLITQPGKRSG